MNCTHLLEIVYIIQVGLGKNIDLFHLKLGLTDHQEHGNVLQVGVLTNANKMADVIVSHMAYVMLFH